MNAGKSGLFTPDAWGSFTLMAPNDAGKKPLLADKIAVFIEKKRFFPAALTIFVT